MRPDYKLNVFENPKIKNYFVKRQTWTGGSPVSSICTDRTDFKLLRAN